MKKIALFISLLLLTAACSNNYRDISIEDARPEDVSFQSTSSVMLTVGLKVNNPTNKKLTITEGIVELFQQNRNVATLTVSEPAEIAPKSNEYNRLVLNVAIKDLMALASLAGMDMNSTNMLEQFDVEGFVKVKAGIARKKVNIERTNAKNFLQSFKK
jgi:LEA14-like dessication related protein